MAFCHLHLHTDSSLLDGMIQLEPLVARVSELGQGACAITDHGLLSGAVKYTKAAKDRGIKPIIGCEVYMATGPDMTAPAKDAGDTFHLTLLARTAEGYRNLSRLATEAHARGFSHKPRLDMTTLARYAEGITLLSGCVGGQLAQLLIHGHEKAALGLLVVYQDAFGEHVWVEVQNHGATGGVDHVREVDKATGEVLMEEHELNDALVALAARAGVGIVATNDAHYLLRDDGDAHDTLLCKAMGKWKPQTDRMRFAGVEHGRYEFYVKDEAEMRALSKAHWWQEACTNTTAVAGTIEDGVVAVGGKTVLPAYQIPADPGYENWKRWGILT